MSSVITVKECQLWPQFLVMRIVRSFVSSVECVPITLKKKIDALKLKLDVQPSHFVRRCQTSAKLPVKLLLNFPSYTAPKGSTFSWIKFAADKLRARFVVRFVVGIRLTSADCWSLRHGLTSPLLRLCACCWSVKAFRRRLDNRPLAENQGTFIQLEMISLFA